MEQDKIQHLRHSLAHLLAAAVLELYPDAQPTLGPAVDDGFYYDFGNLKISEDELPKIEAEMKKILPTWNKFERHEIKPAEAKEFFKNNSYKLELIDEIEKTDEPITFYKSGPPAGEFTDLCRGGHIESAKDINSSAFKLSRIAGAYWRGDEKNPMLTRIYGLAFKTKKELGEYEKMMKEAEKRDHRKLGKELELFTFDDDVGPGLPLWLPKGAVIIDELEKLAEEFESAAGYQRVRTPHIAKESLYLTSGHLPYYQDSMYPPMECEGTKYYLKAMNCPHHHKIFAARSRSYRELPLRLAEYGTVYRYEKSGELFGLMRVRMLQMNDAHIYCAEKDFAGEFKMVNDMYLKYFEILGIKKYLMRFSTHNPEKLGQKYVDEPELWKKTEKMVREALAVSGVPFTEVTDEAAFYGPKIDVQVWSAIGREFTLATNQVDFAQPKRFGLRYTNREGREETPLVIHRAPLSTHERLIGFLIEHYAGAFPVWLAPVQARVLSISEKYTGYAREIYEKLREAGIRAELDDGDDALGKKIRNGKLAKIPYLLVLGEKEKSTETVTAEGREGEKLAGIPLVKFLETISQKIKNRN